MSRSAIKTEHLAALLARDAAYCARPVGLGLALALIGGYVAAFVLFMATLGPRPGALQSAGNNVFFDLKFVIVLALALAAIGAALALSRPQMRRPAWVWLFIVPLLLLAGGIVADLMLWSSDGWQARLVGSNALICLFAIPFLSIPLLAGLLLALRHGATSRPSMSGALAGLGASGLAASLYAAHCTDDSPLFVATWYTIAMAIVTLIGAGLGRRLLRY